MSSGLLGPDGRPISEPEKSGPISRTTEPVHKDQVLVEAAHMAWEDAKVTSGGVPLGEILEALHEEYLECLDMGQYPAGSSFDRWISDAEKTLVARIEHLKSINLDSGLPRNPLIEELVPDMDYVAPGVMEAPSAEDREFQEYALRRSLEAIRAYKAGSIQVDNSQEKFMNTSLGQDLATGALKDKTGPDKDDTVVGL